MGAHLRKGPRGRPAIPDVSVLISCRRRGAGKRWHLVLAGALTLASAAHATAGPELTPCARDIGVTGAECGTVEVWEDRQAQAGRRLGLHVAVLPALGKETNPDPLFMLAGGPGMAATDLAEMAESAFRRIRETRQIVLVDQRGTGDSNGLDCDIDADSTYYVLDDDFPFEALRTCLEGFDADPRLYTTPIAMDDLDEVRAAFGFEQINLWGGSYGTRAALVYLRRHPEHVRSVIVDGLAPPAIRLPVHVGEDAHRAMELLLADCAADADCGAAFPDLHDEFRQLLTRLAAHPETVSAPHPRTGESIDFTVTRTGVVMLVRAALYSVDAARLVPLIIHRAYLEDYAPMLALSDPIGEVGEHLSLGMLFSVLCAEDLSTVDDTDRERIAAEPFMGDAVLSTWGRVCGFWPRGEVAADYYEPVVSDKPVLVLSGHLDPVTPPRWGEMVAEHLPQSLHVVVPGAAHGTLGSGCVQRLMARFVDAASVADLDTSCVATVRRPLFFQSFTGPRVGTVGEASP